MLRHWDKLLFAAGIALLIMLYGMAAGRYDLFPANVVNGAVDAVRDWRSSWRQYLRIRPDKMIERAQYEGEGVVTHDPAAAFPGVTLLAGLWGETIGFRLVDMDGDTLHRWDISVNETFPDQSFLDQPRHDWDAQMHGMALFPNGDIVFNFEGIGVVRIDRCGEILWSLPNYGHHSVFLDDEGDIWVSAARGSQDPKTGLPSINGPVYDEIILQLSPEGEVMREISILDSIYRSGREGLLLAKGRTANTHTEEQGMDLIHLNDVEVLDEAKAGSFPLFEAGDIMISLRNINAVLVLDGETEEVKWSITGPFVAQHDPDFLEDGTISIFDNHRFDGNWAGRPKRSRIVVVDPETSGFRVAYGDQEDQAFYTPRLGKHQYLPNGNILISESQGGRVFEVTPGGDVVWAYVNRWDEDEVAWIVEGLRYPVDFLIMEDAACN